MTEHELQRRKQFVAAAKKHLGRKEADGSHREIIDTYNSIRPLPRGYRMNYTDPWCAAFPSAVGEECGMTSTIILPECSCDAMIALYKAQGRFVEADDFVPNPGDLVMYDWDDSGSGDNRGSADHVGIVTEVTGSKITVIEGNISDSVGYRPITVNGKNIRGYCCPDFASGIVSDTDSVPDEYKERPPASSFQMDAPYGRYLPEPFRILRYGMEGPDVKSLQQLLIAKGYNCGPDQDDGIYGDDTRAAVCMLQEKNSLFCDGEFGPDSHKALWG